MSFESELVRSATEPDPVSVSPGSLSREEGKKSRAISKVDNTETVMRKRNAICTERLLRALRLHHGAPEPEPQYHQPEPEPVAPFTAAFTIPCYPHIPKLTVEQSKQLAIKTIQVAVAADYGLTRDQLISARKSGDLVRPRQVAMYIAKKHALNMGLVTIGRLFGNRDHTTVLYGCRRIEERMQYDFTLRHRVEALEARLLA